MIVQWRKSKLPKYRDPYWDFTKQNFIPSSFTKSYQSGIINIKATSYSLHPNTSQLLIFPQDIVKNEITVK